MTMAKFKSWDPSRNRSDMRIRFTHTTNGLTRHHKWRPNRRWASTTNKNATETHNLKIVVLVKCSSLCCARWFFTQHSHMLSPAPKQRVHRDDAASDGNNTNPNYTHSSFSTKKERETRASLAPRICKRTQMRIIIPLAHASHQAHVIELVSRTWPTT